MTVAPTVAPLYPEVDFPEDPGLSELPNLFNPNWVWETFCQRFERPENDPHQIRIRQFSHSLGRSAIISLRGGMASGRLPPVAALHRKD